MELVSSLSFVCVCTRIPSLSMDRVGNYGCKCSIGVYALYGDICDIPDLLLSIDTCRRAAAAAFQEVEGRQGGIPEGLRIITHADFFALATRRSSYLHVAPKIAGLSESYAQLLLNTLSSLLLSGVLDQDLRILAAASLKKITAMYRELCVKVRPPLGETQDPALERQDEYVQGTRGCGADLLLYLCAYKHLYVHRPLASQGAQV